MQIVLQCSGLPSIKDDMAAIEAVRLRYRDDRAVANLLRSDTPLELETSYPSGWKKFVGPNQGKSQWRVGPDGDFSMLGVRGVSFESDPTKIAAFGLQCRVLRCGEVTGCLTHDRATLPDRG